MRIICQDDSHEMSRLTFSEKKIECQLNILLGAFRIKSILWNVMNAWPFMRPVINL